MLSAHALTDITNAWAFSLHPGIDHRLQCRHIISALSAIKAFEPIHLLVLSDEHYKYATQSCIVRTLLYHCREPLRNSFQGIEKIVEVGASDRAHLHDFFHVWIV